MNQNKPRPYVGLVLVWHVMPLLGRTAKPDSRSLSAEASKKGKVGIL